MTTNLYLERFVDHSLAEDEAIVSLETFICLFLYEYIDRPQNIVVHLVESSDGANAKPLEGLRINVAALNYIKLERDAHDNEIASNCSFPVLLTDGNVVVAGLCGVCRNLVKHANEKHAYLLGFKGSCLVAPAEASIWTKFCEVDIFECTRHILQLIANDSVVNTMLQLPNDLVRFESHMAQPIRMHNVYKLARDLDKERQKQDDLSLKLKKLSVEEETGSEEQQKTGVGQKKYTKKPKTKKIASGAPIESLNIAHKYVEGTEMSIADVILYPHFWMARTVLTSIANKPDALAAHLPLTYKWLNVIEPEDNERLLKCLAFYDLRQNFPVLIGAGTLEFHVNEIQKFSLYKSDPKRYKPSNRIFTKQKDVESSLDKVNQLNIITNAAAPQISESDFGWDAMPFEVLPDAVNVPEKRLVRKKQQLESMARAVIEISKDGDRIVDFCSGTGHLGIILAYKLPNCQVILLENKEESLMRAKQRVDQLKLKNILFFQCNLDYFHGRFDVGVSLHACGVATDIVIKHCIDRKANFVCCPCCYGGCHEMPHIAYPRSKHFRNGGITNRDFMHLAHGADQAHVITMGGSQNSMKCAQGQFCMNIVDTDRKLYAEEIGYRAFLSRLHPENCTPKNRLLVGVYDKDELN